MGCIVHADGGPCHGTQLVDGRCPGCGIVPDMQSTEIARSALTPVSLTPDARRMLDDSIAVLAGLLWAGDDVGRCYSIVSAGSDVARLELAIDFRPSGLNAYAALLKGPAVARDDEPWPTTIAASNPTDD